jgi:large exoprotein involved in heme utilization and adhesion
LFAATELLGGNGGNITLEANGDITTFDIRSDGGRFGGSGNITLTSHTGAVSASNGYIISDTYGTGNAGDISISAQSVLLNGSLVTSRVRSGAVANGGDINITTESLSVSNDAELNASTFGRGNAGNIDIVAGDTVSFESSSVAVSSVGSTGVGNGGNINITTRSLSVSNAAQLIVSTFGKGDAGSIDIFAHNTVSLDGENTLRFPSSIWSNVGRGAVGNGGSINIQAEQLSLSANAALIGDVEPTGQGQAGDINLDIKGTISLIGGGTAPTGESARITLGVQPGGIGSGGNLYIRAGSLVLRDGGIIKASTQAQGDAGNVYIDAGIIDISGSVPSSGLPSGIFTSSETADNAGDITINTQTFRIADGAALSARSKGDGQGGNIRVNTTSFEAVNGGQLITTTFGRGQAGNIFVNATDRVTISGSDPNYTNRIDKFPNPINPLVANAITETGPNSGLFANTETNSTRNGGNIEIVTTNFNLTDGAQISASTSGSGKGGNLTVTASEAVTIRNGTIATSSQQSTGGDITITADRIRLFGDSDIITSVNQGAGGGGNIYLKAGSILAFDDSDILAFARDGRGGDVTLNTPAFFGENYRPAPRNTNPNRLENNNQVDINASGAVSGIITTPDTTFIQNSLTPLPDNQIDTDSLLANSCIVRRNQPTRGSFFITGTGGLPQRPGDAQMSTFPTVDIETLPSDGTPSNTNPNRPWQKGDPIVEPQGVYRLPNGKLVLSRECP